jgi:uncharacterized protein
MSRENVEIMRRMYEAGNAGDMDAFVALLSPDVIWEVRPELPGLREVYRGRAEVRELLSELFEVGESAHTALAQITELSDDRVFTEGVLTGRGKGSGVPVELRYRTVLWVEEGKIARRQVFMERAEALEAAGLSE